METGRVDSQLPYCRCSMVDTYHNIIRMHNGTNQLWNSVKTKFLVMTYCKDSMKVEWTSSNLPIHLNCCYVSFLACVSANLGVCFKHWQGQLFPNDSDHAVNAEGEVEHNNGVKPGFLVTASC